MKNKPESIGFLLETAHPIKFLDEVEPLLNIKLPIPKQIESILNKKSSSSNTSSSEKIEEKKEEKEVANTTTPSTPTTGSLYDNVLVKEDPKEESNSNKIDLNRMASLLNGFNH